MNRTRTTERDLVFCHACQNEFYKSQDIITCPECHSDFTELIDPDFDPRANDDFHPDTDETANEFYTRTPLRRTSSARIDSTRDPDEEDIDEFTRSPGSSYRNRQPNSHDSRPGSYMTGNSFHNHLHHPLIGNFNSMFQNITGGPGNFTNVLNPAQHPGLQVPSGPFQNRSRRMSGQQNHTSGTRVYTRSYPQGGGVHISFTSTGDGWNSFAGRRRGLSDFEDVHDIFQAILGAGMTGARSSPGQAANPLAAIFNQILNPANAQHGDAVFSQEAFDRVMSQLMDQHTGGTAPGPASAAAIAGLPREKVTEEMLDGQAECSICMDNVVVGEEVTILPCKHWFHHACVEAWLKEHDTCPVCRAGIMPKDGPGDVARSPQQAPMHDEGPANVARRQPGTTDHPYVVPESPSASRRRPNPRRLSSDQTHVVDPTSSGRHAGEDSSMGLTGRVRNFFGGGGNGAGNSGKDR